MTVVGNTELITRQLTVADFIELHINKLTKLVRIEICKKIEKLIKLVKILKNSLQTQLGILQHKISGLNFKKSFRDDCAPQ